MKKYLFAASAVLLFVFLAAGTSLVFGKQPEKTKNPVASASSSKTNITPTPSQNPEVTPEPSRGSSAQIRLENAIRKLEQLQERINVPEIGEELSGTIQTQTEANAQIQRKLEEMDARPGLLKFILGPDYKNAGHVRSAVVRLQNQERQMLKIRERLINPQDIATIDEAIQTAQSAVQSYQQLLDQKLQGFSLFGWLLKFMTGYTPAPSPSPSPTVESSVSPSPQASESPQESATPTVIPTATPQ